jgi:methyl-accepting chemotaxis protein
MNALRQLNIGKRLGLAFGALAALLLALVAMAWWQMGAMNRATREMADNWLPSVEQVMAVDVAFTDFRLREFRHVLNTDDQAMAEIEKLLAEDQAAVARHRQDYEKLISSAEERKLYDEFTAVHQQYMKVHAELMALLRQNKTEEARKLLEGRGAELYKVAGDKLDALSALNSRGAAADAAASRSTYQTALALLLGTAALAVVVAVALALVVTRSITQPLAQAVQVTRAVAEGQLGQAVQDQARDEPALLLQSLKTMDDSLVRIVAGVRQGSESIATGSDQIATGSTDLSQRTEEQASALQQTASTMEELGSTVKLNADNARQADDLAKGASSVAEKGGTVVRQVVDTMKGIHDASRRIADITGVIDGIAFQTNILALNAAVEAARAGEQGRGFAVVAGEVRTLAQRSAEAAREIKQLIGQNVERVEQGTQLADTAGSTMEEIVAAVRRVTEIAGEIANASEQQANGVTQVGQAVNQMDQATQQNAALVEESTAAAASLRDQARALQQAVAVFTLPA